MGEIYLPLKYWISPPCCFSSKLLGKSYKKTEKDRENTWSVFNDLHSGKLTWQWNMDLSNMYSLLKMVNFHFHVSLPECIIYFRGPNSPLNFQRVYVCL